MRFASWLLLLAACGGSSGEEKEEEKKMPLTVTIVSPDDGGSYPRNEPLALEVKALRGGHEVDVTRASWTIGDWSAVGSPIEASNLSEGEQTVTVEVLADGDSVTASVTVTVTGREGDTDTDTDADTDTDTSADYHYAGTLEAEVVLSTNDYGDFDDHCSAPITAALTGATLTGGGQCTIFEDFDVDPMIFTLDGTVHNGNNNGDLVMTDTDGAEQRTPYTGTGDPGTPLQATFDNTFRSTDGSLRIYGSWTATVQ
jgi:hypothetical protein